MRPGLVLLLLAVVACEPERDDRADDECTFDDECARDEQCVDRRCRAPLADAGTEDAGMPDARPTLCATKCECAAGEVCSAGVCALAPATCIGIDSCGRGADGDPCEDFVCNAFTGVCFDDDPTPCLEDVDCVGRPGCTDGCRCTGGQTCVSSVECTVADEATSCGAGSFCDGEACDTRPACDSEAECAPVRLTCNVAAGVCVRGNACTSSVDCQGAPATFCEPAFGFCVQPLCTNGGIVCDEGTQCVADGRCVVQGTGAACDVDASCDASEYCSIVNGAGQCTIGCRDNASCDGADVCNGAHQCVDGGLGGPDDSCADDADCAAGLVCGTFNGSCVERCTGVDCAVDGCCPISSLPCCNAFGICGDTGC